MNRSTDWQRRAACRDADPEMFLAETGAEARAARRVCAVCPVREACLTAALAEESGDQAHRAGIRGGRSPRERAGMAKRRRWADRQVKPGARGMRPGGKPLAPCGTAAAYDRHLRRDEPVDEACRLAHNEKRRRERAARRAAGRPVAVSAA